MRWDGPGGYWVSDERDRLDVERIHRWLSDEAYWSLGRSREDVEASIDHSVTLGLFSPSGEQVGVCRWVTDRATFAWLCDVFVAEPHRGEGRGTFLVETAIAHPAVQGVSRMLLATRDAHELYRRFGFDELARAEWWMERAASPIEGTPPGP